MIHHLDFEELLQLLEEHRVDYMIVGGFAVAFHGHPRFTEDMDIFFERSKNNIEKLCIALAAFGFPDEELRREVFAVPGNIMTFGVVPRRVDLLNDIDGVDYHQARPNLLRATYGKTEVSFIGREDLLKNKLSTERGKDKVDVEELTK